MAIPTVAKAAGAAAGKGQWVQPAAQAAGGILGMGLSLGTLNWQNKKQYHQQKRLMELQMRGEKELGLFNQQLAYDMWEKTNYAAQRKQMEKAGLNVGLMYEGGGAGGTTTGGQAGNVAGAQAQIPNVGMAMQLGQQIAMMAAQIENIKADTLVKKTEAAKTAGVDTEQVVANIDNLKATAANTTMNTAVLEFEKQIKEIEKNVADVTQMDVINRMKAEAVKIVGEARQAQAKGDIDEATRDEMIKLAELSITEAGLRIAGQKLGLKATDKQIEKMSAEIQNMAVEQRQNWMKLNQNERELYIKKKLQELQSTTTEFQTSTPQEIKQYTELVQQILDIIFTPAKVGGQVINKIK